MQLQSTADLRLKRRIIWQQTVRDILESDKSHKDKTKSLFSFFSDYAINVVEPEKTINTKNKKVFADLTLRIAQSMTEKQKAHFKSTTEDYIRIFEELAEN